MMFRAPLAALAALVCFSLAHGADAELTFTDPDKAGEDYQDQGEYAGSLGGARHGAQVVALGDGKFDLVLYKGGLPGDGWKRGDERKKASGKREGDAIVFESGDCKAKLAGGSLKIEGDDKSGGSLKKVERKSPTLGAKAPEGAKTLFSGESADAFKNGKTTDDGHLMADCETKDKFGDHTMHLEFRTPFKPFARGQARGNSGVYPQGRYEIQVLDSFGLEGENNECGGIYSIAKPAVNMCYPPLTWQTYDIDFTAARYDESGKKTKNARITVRHNGVVIHDNLELPHGTPGKYPEGPDASPTYLQGHGNPVVYRNIWVVEKK